VIHSGLYYKPGSLKARLSVAGREAMFRFCRQHEIAHERCGKIVVATHQEELPRLEELHRRGEANGLKDMKWLCSEEIREYEPHAAGVRGLLVRETGIVDYKAVAAVLGRLALQRGCELKTDARVVGCRRSGGEILVQTVQGDIRSKAIINCGGLQSDRLARLCGVRPGVRIVPFRGEYYELVPERQHLVRNLIYPVPDPAFPFLGVHFTRMIGRGIEAGPNAVLAFARHGYRKTNFSLKDTVETFTYPGFWRMAGRHWKTGAGEFYRSLSKTAFTKALRRLLPELQAEDLRPGGAGVRAQALTTAGLLLDDFHVVQADRMVHVLNAPSPAATASLSIGNTIAEMACGQFGLD
jgi:L-2-hydroxyglutarate oxidase